MGEDRKKLQEESEIVTKAIIRAKRELDSTREELASLEAKLPGIMARIYLGRESEDVPPLKKRREELLKCVSDRELIFDGLKGELASLKDATDVLFQKASEARSIQHEIDELKGRVREFCANRMTGRDRVEQIEYHLQDILRLSRQIGREEEAKSFFMALNDWRLSECRGNLLDGLEGQP